MESEYHKKYKFGIMDPSTTSGIGSPHDLLSFFRAIEFVTDQPETDYPFLWSLHRRPVFGKDMLPLFEEAKNLRSSMATIPSSVDILTNLDLLGKETRLKTSSNTLAGVFERVFKILADNAPEYVRLSEEYPEINPLEYGSVRIGPIEPLIPSELFRKLPASAFDNADPPLWLRDEIFDQKFYAGKI